MMKKAPKSGGSRSNRLASLLEQLISSYFTQEMDFPGLVSISNIDVAPNMQSAQVWLSIYGAPEDEVLRMVLKERKAIHSYITRQIVSKYTPQLKFKVDPSEGHAQRIGEALRELEEE